MATLRDYFESDNKSVSIAHVLSIFSPDGIDIGHRILFKIHLLLDAHSKFISIYSDENVAFEALLKHLENINLNTCDVLGLMGQTADAEICFGTHDGSEVSVTDLVFTKKIIVYINLELTEQQKETLISKGRNLGINLDVRDIKYAVIKSKSEKPLAFISHAKSDGRDFSIKLTNELARLGCPVWFDEFSLKIGDVLVESIERGLKETEKCIFILSPDFLANEGWCKHEFNTTFMKQMFEKKNVILPIWHGVTKEQVYEYSAALAGIVGLPSALGEPQIAQKIANVLQK